MAILSKPILEPRGLVSLSYGNRKQLQDAFTCQAIAKAEGLLGGHRPHDWQPRAVFLLLNKSDLFVKARTGSGKGKVYQTMIGIIKKLTKAVQKISYRLKY